MVQGSSWPLILALWGAGLGAAGQYGKFSVTFDLLGPLYPEAGAALGFIVSLVGLIGIFLGVAAGMIVSRIRYRRALLWALWLGAALSLFQALLPPLPLLLASRALEGLSHLAIVVAAPTLIAQIAPSASRGLVLTLWGTFFGVAFAILAWGGLPLAKTAGISALLVAHGIYMALFAAILAISLRSNDSPETAAIGLGEVLRQHRVIYRSPRIVAPAAGWLFYTFCFVALLTVLPPYLAPESRAFVIGAMPLVSILSSMTLGVWLLRIMDAVRVIELGFLASALTMIWLWAVPGGITPCLVLAASMGLIQGASFAAVPYLNRGAAEQAQGNGAMAQTGNIGNTLGTPVLAFLLASFGYAALPVTLGLAFVAGLAVHLVLAKRRKGY